MNESPILTEPETSFSLNRPITNAYPEKKSFLRRLLWLIPNCLYIFFLSFFFAMFAHLGKTIIHDGSFGAFCKEFLLYLFFFSWFFFGTKHRPGISNTLIASFSVPFAILTTLSYAYYSLGATDKYSNLANIAEKIAAFIAEPVVEFYAIIGSGVAILIFYAVFIFWQALAGICTDPTKWPNFAVRGFKLIGLEPPERSPFFVYCEIMSAFAAKAFFACSGGLCALFLIAEVFPQYQTGIEVQTPFAFIGNLLFALSFCGLGTFIEGMFSLVEWSSSWHSPIKESAKKVGEKRLISRIFYGAISKVYNISTRNLHKPALESSSGITGSTLIPEQLQAHLPKVSSVNKNKIEETHEDDIMAPTHDPMS
ncbi:MAG: hypothetical protein ABF727_13345 [Gluconobacter oxydans]